MELDELKNTWSSLDERINKNSLFSDAVIRKFIREKADRSVRKLLNYEILGIVILLLMFPFIVYQLDSRFGAHLMRDVCLIFAGILDLALLVWEVYKLRGLLKIDFSKQLSDNAYYINKYNIRLKREKLVMCFAFPVLGALIALVYAQENVSLPMWIILICVLLIAGVLSYWSYRGVFNVYIDSIRKSIEELEELKEEK